MENNTTKPSESLQSILNLSSSFDKKVGISEERVQKIIPTLRKYIAFWREYPDLFVDFLQTGGDPNVKPRFRFYSYQRVFLRAAMRHRKVFACFPRGCDKLMPNISLIAESLKGDNPQVIVKNFNDYSEIGDEDKQISPIEVGLKWME